MKKTRCFTCWTRKGIIRPADPKTLLCDACYAIPLEDAGKKVLHVVYKGKTMRIIELFRLLGYPKTRYTQFKRILRQKKYDTEATIKYFKGRCYAC